MNIQILKIINSWAGNNIWLDKIMIFSAEWLGYFLILLLLTPLLLTLFIKNGIIFSLARSMLLKQSYYKGMLVIAFGSAVASRFIFVTLIRYFYYNPRPFMTLSGVNQLIDHETVSSFPSGHAAFYFALATGVYLYNKKAGYIYFVLAGLIGFARIFAGIHWPVDILGGAILGIITTFLVRYIFQEFFQK